MLTADKFDAIVKQIEVSIETKDLMQQQELDSSCDITFEELFGWQEIKSLAMMRGQIDTEVAQRIYNALGESLSSTNGGWRPNVTLPEKLAITMVMARLVGV